MQLDLIVQECNNNEQVDDANTAVSSFLKLAIPIINQAFAMVRRKMVTIVERQSISHDRQVQLQFRNVNETIRAFRIKCIW